MSLFKEYLITYGWAILIILVVVGVLFYFGIFKPFNPPDLNIEKKCKLLENLLDEGKEIDVECYGQYSGCVCKFYKKIDGFKRLLDTQEYYIDYDE